ncbi:dienelactone hydrolase family protein [Brevundimonas sp. A19_0]|uniref:dienelactone hydrolase family protein n=1 Tax=Brevundimonas sp. A19_0 TaxID=2821087 RepID=UPI001ADCF771|nr:dienelactone hydrolase family protein [Brevundimonas sp. A19_0]MBO9501274.1 dienelactone hydrolase family protein [Brevundimonas sp. A19_0]
MRLTRPEGPADQDFRFSRRALATGGLAGLMFAGYAPAALAQDATPIVTDSEGLVTETIHYEAQDGFDLPAYVARPEGDGPFPVVIVASEIFGVHDYIRDICRRLAKAGYAAMAPAFFVRVEDPAPLTDFSRIQQIVGQAGYEQVMGDISAGLEWLSRQLWARADKVGITGFCWGGKVVWQACARFAVIDAGVAWYGRLAPPADATPDQIAGGQPWPVDLAADLKAPVLGLYGQLDRGIPLESVELMRQALQRAGRTDSRIDVYDGAQHGFHADYRASYKADAAADGWQKLLDLFEARLKS